MNAPTFSIINPEQPKSARILVVEDEALVADYLAEQLQRYGHIVVGITDTGETAISQALTLHPDLVMMDIRLKGAMSGIRAAVEIRKSLDLPVVFLTAFSDQRLLNEAQTAMPYGYLLKPYNERELRAVVQMALYKHHFDRATRENQAWLHSILQSVSDGVVVCNADGKVLFLNPAAEKLTGRNRADALGTSVEELLPFINELSGELISHPLLQAMELGHTIIMPLGTLLVRADGTYLPVADSCSLINDEQGDKAGGVCVFHDDTARRAEEKMILDAEHTRQLEVQIADMEKLDQFKETFISTVNHELLTPLSNMRLALKLLRQPDNGRRETYLAVLETEMERELQLVKALLDLQNLEELSALPLETLRLQEWLPLVVERFRGRVSADGTSLELIVPDDVLLVTYPQLLERVVVELMANACKYTSQDGCIEVQVTNTHQADESIELRFANTTAPISDEQLSQLFEKFYRVPSDAPNYRPGTGLGLTLVRRIVKQLGGQICAERGANAALVFTIQLPMIAART
ncbi:MAG: response regulator [Anaerolineae bacterium]|nr:response regulator [Gloeobacterales cyanobacterium ES-bin-313]